MVSLVRDHPLPGQRRVRVRAEHQARLHVPASAAKATHAGGRGCGGSDRVEADVRPLVSEPMDGLGLGRLERVFGAQLQCPFTCSPGRVHGQHPCAKSSGDDHRGQPHAPTPDHQQPLLGGEVALHGQRVKGGGESTAQGSGGDEVDARRQPDQVEVGRPDRDLLGERPEVGEPRLGLVGTDLSLPGEAPRAPSAPVHEGRGDPVTDGTIPDQRADPGHHAGELVARHHGQRHRIVAPPGVPVRAADAGGPHCDHGPVRRTVGLGQVDQLRRGPVLGVTDCVHGLILPALVDAPVVESVSARYPSGRRQAGPLGPAKKVAPLGGNGAEAPPS